MIDILKEKTYYKLFSFFSKKRKKQLYFLIFLLIFNGALEFFSIASVIPILSIITSKNINDTLPFIGGIITFFGLSDPSLGSLFLLLFVFLYLHQHF